MPYGREEGIQHLLDRILSQREFDKKKALMLNPFAM